MFLIGTFIGEACWNWGHLVCIDTSYIRDIYIYTNATFSNAATIQSTTWYVECHDQTFRRNNVSATYIVCRRWSVALKCVKIDRRTADPRPNVLLSPSSRNISPELPGRLRKNETLAIPKRRCPSLWNVSSCSSLDEDIASHSWSELRSTSRTSDAFPSRRIHPVLGRRRDILGHGNVSV